MDNARNKRNKRLLESTGTGHGRIGKHRKALEKSRKRRKDIGFHGRKRYSP